MPERFFKCICGWKGLGDDLVYLGNSTINCCPVCESTNLTEINTRLIYPSNKYQGLNLDEESSLNVTKFKGRRNV